MRYSQACRAVRSRSGGDRPRSVRKRARRRSRFGLRRGGGIQLRRRRRLLVGNEEAVHGSADSPSYSVEALSVLGAKKDLRIMAASMDSATNKTGKAFPRYSVKQALGGLLVQEVDTLLPKDEEWRVVSKRAPTDQEIRDLRLAMVVAKHVRSNAIVLAKDGATVGIGGGQPNRVDCVKIAVERGKDNVRGSSMASDAFFPFPDSIEEAAKAGVSAVAHPGGSKKDAETLAVADANGMALVITGARHFRH